MSHDNLKMVAILSQLSPLMQKIYDNSDSFKERFLSQHEVFEIDRLWFDSLCLKVEFTTLVGASGNAYVLADDLLDWLNNLEGE